MKKRIYLLIAMLPLLLFELLVVASVIVNVAEMVLPHQSHSQAFHFFAHLAMALCGASAVGALGRQVRRWLS